MEQSAIDGIVETVPTYRSLLVHYKPEIIGFKALTEKFESLMSSLSSIQIPPPTVIEIPVLYGGEMGPDIENVASHNHKTVEEVIASVTELCRRTDRNLSGRFPGRMAVDRKNALKAL